MNQDELAQSGTGTQSGYRDHNATGGNSIRASGASLIVMETPRLLTLSLVACTMAGAALLGIFLLLPVIDAKVKGSQATCDLALKTAYTAKDQVDFAIAKTKVKEEDKK